VRPRGLCVPPDAAPRLRRARRLDASVLVPNLRHALLLTLTVDVGIVVIHVVHLPSPVVSTTVSRARRTGGVTYGFRKMCALSPTSLFASLCVPNDPMSRFSKSGSTRTMSWSCVTLLVLLSRAFGVVFVSETTKATLLGRPRWTSLRCCGSSRSASPRGFPEGRDRRHATPPWRTQSPGRSRRSDVVPRGDRSNSPPFPEMNARHYTLRARPARGISPRIF